MGELGELGGLEELEKSEELGELGELGIENRWPALFILSNNAKDGSQSERTTASRHNVNNLPLAISSTSPNMFNCLNV